MRDDIEGQCSKTAEHICPKIWKTTLLYGIIYRLQKQQDFMMEGINVGIIGMVLK
jgi:hypothetical protein